MNQTIQLPWPKPPLTANELRRMLYREEANVRKILIGEATTAIRRAKTEPMAGAELTLHFRPATWQRRDTDGMWPTMKILADALVKEKVLEDDSFKFVPISSCYIHEPTRGTPGAMWLTLEEVYK